MQIYNGVRLLTCKIHSRNIDKIIYIVKIIRGDIPWLLENQDRNQKVSKGTYKLKMLKQSVHISVIKIYILTVEGMI